MLEDRLHHPPCAARAVAERIGRARLPARHIIDMILQVGADAGAVEHNLDPLAGEVRGRPAPGQHPNPRTAERPRRHHTPAPPPPRLAVLPPPAPPPRPPPPP